MVSIDTFCQQKYSDNLNYFLDLIGLDVNYKNQGLRIGWILFPEQSKEQCDEKADEDGSGEGKVESEFLLFNQKISGKLSDPWDFIAGHQKQTNQYNKDAQKDK
jgi:hypothetical protein